MEVNERVVELVERLQKTQREIKEENPKFEDLVNAFCLGVDGENNLYMNDKMEKKERIVIQGMQYVVNLSVAGAVESVREILDYINKDSIPLSKTFVSFKIQELIAYIAGILSQL